jgi:hypothetical protein
MTAFTVDRVQATGKSDPKFGEEFYVKFTESESTYPLWFKKVPTQGQTIDGDIIDGKFKKTKKEWNPNPQNPQSSVVATQDAPSAPRYTPYKKDNSDGQRQGMCINNAAAYIAATSGEERYVDGEAWAKEVHAFATALYQLGDLSSEPKEQEENLADTVTELFG